MKYKSSGKQQQGYTPIPDQPKDKESQPLSGTSIYKIRPSFTLLPQLRNEEKEFFDLVRSGDEYSVLEFLKRSPDFNVNCQDYESNSPLHIAVYNEDVEMVELLLARGVQVMDCHLHAIKLGNTAIFSLLLDKIAENDPTLEFQGYLNSAEFSSGMTPLILAAQHEHYDIIKLLLDRGHKISPPHRPDCLCKKQCRYSKKKESLTNSLRRINTFRALASSAYISQCSYDPILTAFQLSHELQQCAEIEKEFTLEYLSLADRLQHFSVSLLDLCRTTDEVKLVLRQTADGTTSASKFPRLTFAIDTKQKDFLAHPNCQQVLYANWMGEWGDWKAMSFARKTLRVVPQVMLMPVFTFLFWVAPKSKLVRWWQSPISKFINSTVMYIVFLLLLFAETQLYKNFHTRGPPNTGFEWPIMIWVMGFLWEDSKHLYRVGFRKYFGDWWNCYNMTMTLSFIINFAAWLWSYLDVKWWGNKYLERKYWHAHDATLIGEGMFALSTVQAFSRLQYIFQINQHLGPQQISLSHMIQDILKFLSLFFLVMISFTTGLNRLYTYYSGMVRIDQTGLKKIQLGSFTSFQSTFKTLFWSVFAMSPVESADVVIENLGNSTHPIINKHSFTEGVGYVLFASYHVIVVVVFLNMLIAMMANSFQKVTDNADREWKFARAKVWVGYMDSADMAPVPCNLVPSPRSVVWLIASVIAKLSGTPVKNICCYQKFFDEEDYSHGSGTKNAENYQLLMSQLVQRYIKRCKMENEHQPVTTKHLESLQQELYYVKQRMKTLLSNATSSRKESPMQPQLLPPSDNEILTENEYD